MFDFKFDWVNSLNTGIQSIDEQHRQLFKIGRDMEQLLRIQCIGVTDKQLIDIVCELRDFTGYHFYEEERMMEEICYPHITAHKKFHKRCSDFIMKIDVPKLKEHPMEQLKIIRDEVQEWIMNHVANEDATMAEAYKKYQEEQKKRENANVISPEECFGDFIREYDMTKIYLCKDQSMKGHLVAVFKETARELCKLSTLERNLFFADISKAAKVVKKLYEPDAICYVDLEDADTGLVVHILPKYKENGMYGMMPDLYHDTDQRQTDAYKAICEDVKKAFGA